MQRGFLFFEISFVMPLSPFKKKKTFEKQKEAPRDSEVWKTLYRDILSMWVRRTTDKNWGKLDKKDKKNNTHILKMHNIVVKVSDK